MLAVCVSVTLSLLLMSGSQAAPLSCEDLLKPLELNNINQSLGKWLAVAWSTNHPDWKKTQPNSAWMGVLVATQNKTVASSLSINISIGSEIAKFLYINLVSINDLCMRYNYTVTLHANNTLSTLHANNVLIKSGLLPSTAVILPTCPDCLLVLETYILEDRSFKSIKLLSRRRELNAAELESFKKQVDCLSLPPSTFMDPQKDLCPDTSLLLEDLLDNLAKAFGTRA